jgi:hypothetical protein
MSYGARTGRHRSHSATGMSARWVMLNQLPELSRKVASTP